MGSSGCCPKRLRSIRDALENPRSSILAVVRHVGADQRVWVTDTSDSAFYYTPQAYPPGAILLFRSVSVSQNHQGIRLQHDSILHPERYPISSLGVIEDATGRFLPSTESHTEGNRLDEAEKRALDNLILWYRQVHLPRQSLGSLSCFERSLSQLQVGNESHVVARVLDIQDIVPGKGRKRKRPLPYTVVSLLQRQTALALHFRGRSEIRNVLQQAIAQSSSVRLSRVTLHAVSPFAILPEGPVLVLNDDSTAVVAEEVATQGFLSGTQAMGEDTPTATNHSIGGPRYRTVITSLCDLVCDSTSFTQQPHRDWNRIVENLSTDSFATLGDGTVARASPTIVHELFGAVPFHEWTRPGTTYSVVLNVVRRLVDEVIELEWELQSDDDSDQWHVTSVMLSKLEWTNSI